MKWIKELLNGGSDVSHKRLISVLSFIVLIGMVVLNYFGQIVQVELIYVFCGLVFGNNALTVFEKFKKDVDKE